MLGPPKPRRLDEPLTVTLEGIVLASNVYRHLEETLDLNFVREWTRNLYADRGRPSIDPVVFFKLQLIIFFEGIRSERKLIGTASLNLAHRWYPGYALDEVLPDHSSLTRIRLVSLDSEHQFHHSSRSVLTGAGINVGWEGFNLPAELSRLPVATGPAQAPRPCLPSDSWDSA